MNTYSYHKRQVDEAVAKLQELNSERDVQIGNLPPEDWSTAKDKRSAILEEIALLDSKIEKQEEALKGKRGRLDRSAMVARRIIVERAKEASALEKGVRGEYVVKASDRAKYGRGGFESKYAMLSDELSSASKYVNSLTKLHKKLEYEFGSLAVALDVLEEYGMDRSVLEEIGGLGFDTKGNE